MKPSLIFSDIPEIAKSVKNDLKAHGWQYVREFFWNRVDSINTEWWLIPGSKRPSYKYGKLFFSPDSRRVTDDCLFCGLLVEKGLEQNAVGLFSNDLIMKNDWIWHDLYRDIGTGKITSAISNASQKSNAPVRILLEAGIEKGTRPGYFNRTWPDVCGIFFRTYDGSALELQPNFSIHPDYLWLKKSITVIKRLSDLTNFIDHALSEVKFIWVNIYMGIYFRKGSEILEPGAWDVEQLWDNALSVWQPWFK